MKNKKITLSKKELRAIIQQEIDRPKVVYFSISEAVQRNRERIRQILNNEFYSSPSRV